MRRQISVQVFTPELRPQSPRIIALQVHGAALAEEAYKDITIEELP